MDFKDNSKEFIEAKNEAVKIALETIGLKAEGYAKRECPVDTGRLRNSIAYTTAESDVYVGTNVEYAPRVEYDDKVYHTVGNAHFLRNAATQHSDEYKEIVEKQLKS